MEELYKVSEIETPSDSDFDYALGLLEEAQKLEDNAEFMKNLKTYANKKAKIITSVADLRAAANEMAMNPARTFAEEDEFLEKKKKRLEKKAS